MAGTDDAIRIVFGTGNPGFRYRGTRHNVGFMVLDELSRAQGIRFRRKEHFLAGEGRLPGGTRIVLVKPKTYVNRSGIAFVAARKMYTCPSEQVLVVCDDISLPLGAARLRASGGSGGHHGLESICGAAGTEAFPRLRIGIGPVGGDDVVRFVLSRFARREREDVNRAIANGAEAARVWAAEGIEQAMQRFNKKGVGVA